jgi:hypothetical protein
VLNGGTTNTNLSTEDGLPFGTLNRHLMTLDELNVRYEKFYEPDLGDQLTAIVFVVDERIFNKTKYPEPFDIMLNLESKTNYIESIGGVNNYKLREFLKQFKLA